MRVLGFVRAFDSGSVFPPSYYRVQLPLAALNKRTQHEAVAYDQFGIRNMFLLARQHGLDPDSVLDGYDVYVTSRLFRDEGADEAMDALRESGGKVVFDTDDDLSEQYRHLEGRGDEFVNQMHRVDLITVSTPYLAERVEELAGRDAVVLPNHLDCEWFTKASMNTEKKSSKLTLGVVGTKTHLEDWRCLEDAFKRLSEEYDIEVLVAGFQPSYLKAYTYLKAVPYEAYPGLMRQFDIVCCALDPDDPFNLSKSGIKALEAMSAARSVNGRVGGAVPVCTDMPVYRRVVNHRHNGLLVDNDGWYEALKQLIENNRMRRQLAHVSHKWVHANRDIKHGYRLWKRAYVDLLEGRNGNH